MDQPSQLEFVEALDSADSKSSFIKRRIYYWVKDVLDFILAALALLVLAPAIASIAMIISLDSPGPIFFRQRRVGTRMRCQGNTIIWEKVDFPCFKFRSMFHKASTAQHQAYVTALINNDASVLEQMEDETVPLHKLVHDRRITRVGKYLREYSLDELPQFWNVLRGEMSLVGPRPAIPYEVEVYKPWHLGRLQAKPGITGLQQVSARYTASFDDQVRCDLEYIEHQSLWLDLRILIKTPLAIFKQKGA
jgi:lipopolysaccharide/colanic/teichoic acid biosynthesis glycosyltransferase